MDGGSLSDFLKTVKTIPEDYLAAICKQASDMWQKLHIVSLL
jgi:mitogen-activated protein kinase kinase 1